MHFAVAGPGALGCLLSFFLAEALQEEDTLHLIDHDQARADKLNKKGLYYRAGQEWHRFFVPVTAEVQHIQPADVLFLCVKSYDLKHCIERCSPLISATTLVVFLQNGISHLSWRDSLLGKQAVFGTTSEGAYLEKHGNVVHSGSGMTYLGFTDPPKNNGLRRLHEVAKTLQEAGIRSSVTDDITQRLWDKLFVNVGINALTAIHHCTNGELLDNQSHRATLRAAVTEAVEVAHASGIQPSSDAIAHCEDVCRKTASNFSSMLQDVRHKRKTEIDSINGAVVRLAAQNRIETPVNRQLTAKIEEIETSYIK